MANANSGGLAPAGGRGLTERPLMVYLGKLPVEALTVTRGHLCGVSE